MHRAMQEQPAHSGLNVPWEPVPRDRDWDNGQMGSIEKETTKSPKPKKPTRH